MTQQTPDRPAASPAPPDTAPAATDQESPAQENENPAGESGEQAGADTPEARAAAAAAAEAAAEAKWQAWVTEQESRPAQPAQSAPPAQSAQPPVPPAAPGPGWPGMNPWAPPQPPAAPKPPLVHRRWVRAVTRWTLAAALFAGAATVTGQQISARERTDVPGLATAADGRWDYPELSLPPLPEGSPPPFANANKAQIHHADLRALLLPPPETAEAHPELDGTDWLEPAGFAGLMDSEEQREDLAEAFATHPLRQIAQRGWTMPDGTTTEIYLLRFTTGAVADALFDREFGTLGTHKDLAVAPKTEPDEGWPEENGRIGQVTTVVRTEAAPYTEGHTRLAYLRAGDVLGLVVQTHPDDAAEVPFHQTVILQAQLLG
ncbi:hypothetical protein [Streptomyces aidingensis]|uniref:Uncharacterized protein n=1 Tax=Streptomyces aidingensis TaxID=910347 RepID=A0A1I1HRF4_9ACTN|nr:hypothetical protein [Streptomyces aidingensis]SFC26132.1 hypothetical protein SAMN05421773_102482 [Streptomyces aidingensis]